jgi:hypothetical protein
LVSTNPYTAGNGGTWTHATLAAVTLGEIHPAAPLQVTGDSVGVWVVLAIVLAVILASGLVWTSRR